MRLTLRDAVSTAIVLAGLAMGLSVLAGWNWPLLGGVRAGIVAVAIAGFAACMLASALESFYFTDPFGVMTFLVAMGAMAIGIVGGLISDSEEFLLMLMLVVAMLWLLATLRHAIEGGRPAGAAKIAG